MNFLPNDLKTQIYLSLPYPEVLTSLPNPPSNFWVMKADHDIGAQVSSEFKDQPASEIHKYIITLALHGIAVRGNVSQNIPGSEIILSSSEMIRHAWDKKDKELAEYTVEVMEPLNDMLYGEITTILDESNWIDILIEIVKKNDKLDEFHNYGLLNYFNPGDKVKEFHQVFSRRPKRENHYETQIKIDYMIVLGLTPKFTEIENGSELCYLAIKYGDPKMVPKIENKSLDPIFPEAIVGGWIYRDPNKALSLINNNLDFGNGWIGSALSRTDNLPLLTSILSKIGKENQRILISKCVVLSNYGSQIFTCILDNYDLNNLGNQIDVRDKITTDFAGSMEILNKLSPKLKDKEVRSVIESFDIPKKIQGYLSYWINSKNQTSP